jgi:2-polyprenyl-6-methoxyphenol hydroxylase-like FAD-dependent oxidoreductase
VRIVVIGGGIGGLSAAIALGRAGNEVVVPERALRIDPVGAGITLFANAMSALDRLGVRDAVAAQGAATKRSAILTSDGRELTRVPPDLLKGTIALHRSPTDSHTARSSRPRSPSTRRSAGRGRSSSSRCRVESIKPRNTGARLGVD